MININGKTYNIQKPMICRVSLPPSDVHTNSDFLYVTNSNNINNRLFSGLILNNNDDYALDIPAFRIKNQVKLSDGDILLIEPSGKALKIYDSTSVTNSIFLTEQCNSRCLMCPQPPKIKDEFNYFEIANQSIKLMDKRTPALGITGGEPTVKWKDLIEILKACKEYLPSTHIQLLTNARILKKYQKAKELSSVDIENFFIGVPLYSDIDDFHDYLCGVKGSFWETIEGLYNLERVGIFIELRIVITKANFKRLSNFSHFVYRTIPFVGNVVFMGLEPIGMALKNIEELWIDPIDYMGELESAIHLLQQRNINSYIFNHQLCTLPKHLWGLSKKSISEWKIIYFDECVSCIEKDNCGGFFFSSKRFKSKAILPIKEGG